MIKYSFAPYTPRPPYQGPNPDRCGPDGNGMDARIKSPEDLKRVIGELVGSLISLEVFVWYSTCTAMPTSVFDALTKATNLRKLRVVAQNEPYHEAICEWRSVKMTLEVAENQSSPFAQCHSGSS